MIALTIDGKTVQVPEGTTVLDAAEKLGVRIPTLCHLPGHPDPPTSCFVCVVRIQGHRTLVPSCAMKVQEGMVVTADSEEVRAARVAALELLLSEHRGDCVAPCELACPAGLDVAALCEHLARGENAEAIAVARRTIPFNSVLGRICPRFCERACRRGLLDEPVTIAALQALTGDLALEVTPQAQSSTGRHLAVVGAGPAGLSAAFYLLAAGHDCTILDAGNEAGGRLRAISEECLPRLVLDREIDVIRRMGARFRMNAPLLDRESLDELCVEFDAVLLTLGASRGSGDARSVDLELLRKLGLGVSTKGLAVDADGATAMAKVFAAGESVYGTGYAVRAVAAGRAAAEAIDRFLTSAARPTKLINVRMGKLSDEELKVVRCDADPAARVTSEPLSSAEAVGQARRCLSCSCSARQDCDLRRLASVHGANPNRYRGASRTFKRVLSHSAVVLEPGKCILCGRCVRITADAAEAFGLTFVGRGFSTTPEVPLGRTLAQGLTTSAESVVQACPTGALALRRKLNGT